MFFKQFLLNINELLIFLSIKNYLEKDVWCYGIWNNMQHL